MKIYPSLVLWGVRMGYMSYGWDAGVLGGIIETTEFQSAMKVTCERKPCDSTLSNSWAVPQHHNFLHDCCCVSIGLMAWVLYCSFSME